MRKISGVFSATTVCPFVDRRNVPIVEIGTYVKNLILLWQIIFSRIRSRVTGCDLLFTIFFFVLQNSHAHFVPHENSAKILIEVLRCQNFTTT